MVLAVLRVWLDDRPGSLASVAGRIGALEGDLIGIDVLERGGGRVIDEFVVELSDIEALDKIVSAVDGLEGVDVELADVVEPSSRLRRMASCWRFSSPRAGDASVAPGR